MSFSIKPRLGRASVRSRPGRASTMPRPGHTRMISRYRWLGGWRPEARRLIVAASSAILFLALSSAAAGQQPPRVEEYELKAIFITNFLKYVEWPETAFEDAESPLVVGIQGSDPFGPALDKLVTQLQPIIGRKVVTETYESEPPDGAFHVLFVPESERKETKKILGGVCGRPVLTVGEQRGFAEDGGVINFVTERKRIRFEVNLRCAQAGGLNLSAQLLKLARKVYDPEDERGG